ncbi:response regulator [Haliangium sp.]|uniref:response regulator n=1 Tax=Haliangium sp. TaxID=2663208 RepID=UPI003D1125C5
MSSQILVADDEAGIRALLEAELTAEGHDVHLVADGEQAVAEVRVHDYDVVVSDVLMPGRNGLEVLRAVREMSPATEVVIMTAYASLDTALECLRAGAFDFVRKPFNLDQLNNTVRRAAERTRLRTSAALYRACLAIGAADGGETLGEHIAQVAKDALHADHVAMLVPAPHGGWQVGFATPRVGADADADAGAGTLDADLARLSDDAIAGRAARERVPLLLPRDLDRPNPGATLVSTIVYPLGIEDPAASVDAVLCLSRTRATRAFRAVDVECAAILAAQAGLTVRNQRLFERLAISERLVAMGQLSAGVAHEIKNPLSSVVTNLEVLRAELDLLDRRGPDGEPRPAAALTQVDDILRDVDEGLRRIDEIVRDVQSLARSGHGQRLRFELNDAVRTAVRLARPHLRRRTQVELSLGPDTAIMGSYGRMCQVFLNLLVNAGRAIAEAGRGGRIEITTARCADEVVVTVSDDGVGIAPEHLGRVMQPLFTTKTEGPGGLGLSISRDIVAWHHGTIEVASTPGAGATFTLALPAAS